MEKKRILIVIPKLVIGGAERLTIYLLNRIDRKKFDLGLCLFEDIGEFKKHIPEDVKVYLLKKKNRWSFFRLIKRFKLVIDEYNPQIIYTRMWYATLISVIVRLIYFIKIPLLANEEHNHIVEIKGYAILNILKRYLIAWAYRKSDLVIVPSYGVRRDISKKYKVPIIKTIVIYNSVDINLIENSIKSEIDNKIAKKFDKDIPVIVAFGRLIKRKGFEDLLNAFKIVHSKMKIRLIFIGDGEERNRLECLSKQMGLENDVIFLGYQENPFTIIAKSNIFVLSSHWEGFGNVIIEAMACGIPIISTKCPYGPDEIIADGENGILISVGNPYEMAQKIIMLLNDKARLQKLSEGGKKRAKDFTVEKMVSGYEMVFEHYLVSCPIINRPIST